MNSNQVPIGTQIRMIRAARDLNLQGLGTLSGVHYSHISNIENSHYPPRPDQLAALEAALGIRFSDPVVQAAFSILAGNNHTQQENPPNEQI